MTSEAYICNGHYLKKTCLRRGKAVRYGFHDLYRDEAGETVMPIGIHNKNSCVPNKLMVIYQYLVPADVSLGGGPRFLVPCSDRGKLRYAKVILNRSDLPEYWHSGKGGISIGSDYPDSMHKFLNLDDNQKFEIINAHPRGEEILTELTRNAHKISNEMADAHYQGLPIYNKKTFTQNGIPELEHIGGDYGDDISEHSGKYEHLDFDVDSSLIGSIYKTSDDTAARMSFTAQLIGKKVSKVKKPKSGAKPKTKKGKAKSKAMKSGAKKPKTKKTKAGSPSTLGDKVIDKSKKSTAPSKKKVPKKTAKTDKTAKKPKVGILGEDGAVAPVNAAKSDKKMGKKAKAIPKEPKDATGKKGGLQGAPKPDKKSKIVEGLGSNKGTPTKAPTSSSPGLFSSIVRDGVTAGAAAGTQALVDQGVSVISTSGRRVADDTPVEEEWVSPEETDATTPENELSEATDLQGDGDENEAETSEETSENAPVSQFANPEQISYAYGEFGNLYSKNKLPVVYNVGPAKYGPEGSRSVLVHESTLHGNTAAGKYVFIVPCDDTLPNSWPSKFANIACSCNDARKKRKAQSLTMAQAASIISEEMSTDADTTNGNGPLTAEDIDVQESDADTSATTEDDTTTAPEGEGEEATKESDETTADGDETEATETQKPAEIVMPEKVLDPKFDPRPTTIPGAFVFFVPAVDADRDGKGDLLPITNRDGGRILASMIGQEAETEVVPGQGTTVVETIEMVPQKKRVVIPTPQPIMIAPTPIPYWSDGRRSCSRSGRCGVRDDRYREPAPLLTDINSGSPLPHTVNGSSWIRSPLQIEQLISSVVRPQIAKWCHSTIDRISSALHGGKIANSAQ